MSVTFEVLGTPAPQGDKSAVMIGGKPRLIEGRRTGGRERHKSWRAAVADAARDVAGHDDVAAPLDGALHLEVEFRCAMPASRPKRIQAAGIAPKTTPPDLDKLLRSLGDSLKEGGLVRDDARFARITAEKNEVVGWTGAVITITPLEQP